MDTSGISLKARATEVARDLILENNDAPVGTEQLLALCYIRAFTDGVLASTVASSHQRHQRVITGTGNGYERRELQALCDGLRSAP